MFEGVTDDVIFGCDAILTSTSLESTLCVLNRVVVHALMKGY